MHHDNPPHELPAPLKQLQNTPPGMLYMLAGKAHILDATRLCDRTIVAAAEWNRDKTALTLVCVDGAQLEIRADDQMQYCCDCRHWTKNSQCPHLAALWIQLKRLVSPASFPHLQIRSQILQNLADLIDFPHTEPAEQQQVYQNPHLASLMNRTGVISADTLALGDTPRQADARATRKQARLVLEENYGRLRGSVYFGSEQVNRWSTGIPTQVLGYVQRLPYFEATIRYFTNFVSLSDNRCPIVFRHESGAETVLKLCADVPRRACLTFAHDARQVSVSRTLDGTAPLPEAAVHSYELLLDLEACTIHPLTGREVWAVWGSIEDKLLNGKEGSDEEQEQGGKESEDEEEWDDDWDDEVEEEYDDTDNEGFDLQRGAHQISASIERFNALALRLNPDAIPGAVHFLDNGRAVTTSERITPICLLELPDRLDSETISMTPRIDFNQQSYPFSADLFRYFDSGSRSLLPGPLRAKKRVRGLMECCLALPDAATVTARRSIIKEALSGPDYLKRSVKSEARKILNAFAEEYAQKPLLIQAAPDGWHFASDDRPAQVRLVRILFELFGPAAFDTYGSPAEASISRSDLLARLPQLADRLQRGGFSLRLGNQPLASAVWDFALDATSSTLDWFELRPEIRCDGELLNPDELQHLVAGGILQRDGRMILIDDISARILAMLIGATGSATRKKKGEQRVVRIPRLQILDWLQLRSQGVTVRLAPEEAGIMESLLNFDAINCRPLPPALTATLRPYQHDGYQWLGFLYEHRFGACLADDMGLGKTVQAISLLTGIADGLIASAAAADTPHLIIVPPSLIFNWESEIARFFPTASLLIYSGQKRSCLDFNRFDIILTSYGIIQRDIDQLATLRFNVIIFDEAQTVKNLQAATTGAARQLNGAFKLALTGTPVENRIEEYYAIMDLCLPGLLGTPEEFSRSLGNRAQGGIETLLRRTRPFILRRNKQLIAADLPDKIECDIHLELSPKQRVLYQRTVEEVRGQVEEAYANRAAGQARIIALTAILRLRQICLAPSLALPGTSDASPKLEFLVEQLQELRDEGHSVLVFSQFTSYLDIVEAGLKHHKLAYLRLDGSTPVPQRKALVQNFQNSTEPTVFLISLKAGGKGLNLTRATYVYHLDPWWNPAVENQASDRAHRIGQTRQVTITRLIMRHTIEEKMMILKEQKLKLYKAILDEGSAGGGASLSREDFDFLLG
jgi:non-specific serine/threonine protein kinase